MTDKARYGDLHERMMRAELYVLAFARRAGVIWNLSDKAITEVLHRAYSKADAENPAFERLAAGIDVVLTSHGDNKIGVIKEIRAATGFGLREAKDLVESAPVVAIADLSASRAMEVKRNLEASGATVELREANNAA